MQNIVQKAKICSVRIKEGYTCMLDLDILDENGNYDFSQGFGGAKFNSHDDYEFWKNALENIASRRFEDINDATIQAIVTPVIILGIGSLDNNYWLVREENKFIKKDTRAEIDEFFEKHNVKPLKIEKAITDRER